MIESPSFRGRGETVEILTFEHVQLRSVRDNPNGIEGWNVCRFGVIENPLETHDECVSIRDGVNTSESPCTRAAASGWRTDDRTERGGSRGVRTSFVSAASAEEDRPRWSEGRTKKKNPKRRIRMYDPLLRVYKRDSI